MVGWFLLLRLMAVHYSDCVSKNLTNHSCHWTQGHNLKGFCVTAEVLSLSKDPASDVMNCRAGIEEILQLLCASGCCARDLSCCGDHQDLDSILSGDTAGEQKQADRSQLLQRARSSLRTTRDRPPHPSPRRPKCASTWQRSLPLEAAFRPLWLQSGPASTPQPPRILPPEAI